MRAWISGLALTACTPGVHHLGDAPAIGTTTGQTPVASTSGAVPDEDGTTTGGTGEDALRNDVPPPACINDGSVEICAEFGPDGSGARTTVRKFDGATQRCSGISMLDQVGTAGGPVFPDVSVPSGWELSSAWVDAPANACQRCAVPDGNVDDPDAVGGSVEWVDNQLDLDIEVGADRIAAEQLAPVSCP